MDSLLSITASVTGILTFFAAVWAFIYVRYTTLKDRDEEILKKDHDSSVKQYSRSFPDNDVKKRDKEEG